MERVHLGGGGLDRRRGARGSALNARKPKLSHRDREAKVRVVKRLALPAKATKLQPSRAPVENQVFGPTVRAAGVTE